MRSFGTFIGFCILAALSVANPQTQEQGAQRETRAVTVHVGDGTADCSRLLPFNHAWSWRVVMPDGTVRPQGIWSDHLDATILNGRPALRRVQGMTYLNGLSTTGVLFVDPATCAPISSEQHRLHDVVLKHSFIDGHIVTERTEPPAAMRSTTIDVAETPFDFLNGEDGPLLAAFPLRVGYSATMLVAQDLPAGDGTTEVSFRVLREEIIDAGAMGRVRTFVIESPLPGGEGIQTFWISRSPPYFIRLVITYADHRYTHYFDNI
jgi:hypothetical protein